MRSFHTTEFTCREVISTIADYYVGRRCRREDASGPIDVSVSVGTTARVTIEASSISTVSVSVGTTARVTIAASSISTVSVGTTARVTIAASVNADFVASIIVIAVIIGRAAIEPHAQGIIRAAIDTKSETVATSSQ